MSGRIARLVALLSFGLALSGGPARAGGFLIYDLSGEATGRGSAVVADTAEPAAVWYNPAALSFMPGVRLSVGLESVFIDTRFEPDGGGDSVDTEAQAFFIPNLFATAQLTEWLAAGVGLYSVFGLGNEWPDDWLGREFSIESDLQTLTVNPCVSFRVLPELSLAVGFDAVRGVVDLTNGLPEPLGGEVRVAGEGWGYGANVGVLWRALPETFHVAATYRSRVKLPFSGRVDFDPRPEFARELPDQGGDAEVTLPDILTVGALYRPMPSLSLTLDVNVVFWSTYDRTVLDFETVPDEVLEHNYETSVVVRAGVDWATPVEGLRVRGGLIWDQGPAPAEYMDPSQPDADQIDVTVGLGYAWRWFTADIGYQLLVFFPGDATTGRFGPEGTYRTLGHFLVTTLSVALGG